MTEAKNSEKKKILLLDDNPVHREVVFDGLEDFGFEVETAKNIEEAKGILESGFLPDLFILDIVIDLNNRGGVQFAQHIRENSAYNDAPILYISAHLDQMNIEKYMPEVVNEEILPKPFDFEDLINKIREVMRK